MQARSKVGTLEGALEAIASARRREILYMVWEGERSAGEIAAASDVSWPAVSQNLRLLKTTGLVLERRAGTRRYYRADRNALGPLEAVLRQMWTRDLGRLGRLAEEEARRSRRDRRPG